MLSPRAKVKASKNNFHLTYLVEGHVWKDTALD